MTQLRVASYNIHACLGMDGHRNPARIASVPNIAWSVATFCDSLILPSFRCRISATCANSRKFPFLSLNEMPSESNAAAADFVCGSSRSSIVFSDVPASLPLIPF